MTEKRDPIGNTKTRVKVGTVLLRIRISKKWIIDIPSEQISAGDFMLRGVVFRAEAKSNLTKLVLDINTLYVGNTARVWAWRK